MAARKKAARKRGQRTASCRKDNVSTYRVFLNAYRKTGNMTASAEVAGIDRETVKERMRRDPAWAKLVYAARAKVVNDLATAQIRAATVADAQGRIDSKAGQFMLTNLAPEDYKHRREDTLFDGGAYDSAVRRAASAMDETERAELREIAKRKILQRGSGDP